MKKYILIPSLILSCFNFSWAHDYRPSLIVEKNPELTKRFDYIRELSHQKSRQTLVAVIGDYVHPHAFLSTLALNEGERENTFSDDDGNGFIDDYFGFDVNQGHGRLLHPVNTGHENGIVSLLDAYTQHYGLEETIKIIPININTFEIKFDDHYMRKLADAIDYARTRGAKVVSMSLGVSNDYNSFFRFLNNSPEQSRAYFNAAVKRAVEAGMILLGANSNNNQRDQTVELCLPANSPGVISVANINYQGVIQSAYGANTDVGFYGTDIYVWSGDKEGYEWQKGSSYATPLVAFSIAVANSFAEREIAHVEQMRSKLRRSCEKALVGRKNIASRCIYSPEKFVY